MKRGPKTGRVAHLIDLPPCEAEALAAWRRHIAFALVGAMTGTLPGRAYRVLLRAGLVLQARSLLAVTTEVVDALVVAGLVPNGESVVDVKVAWDRVVAPGSVLVEVATTVPPQHRPTIAGRAKSRATMTARQNRINSEASRTLTAENHT